MLILNHDVRGSMCATHATQIKGQSVPIRQRACSHTNGVEHDATTRTRTDDVRRLSASNHALYDACVQLCAAHTLCLLIVHATGTEMTDEIRTHYRLHFATRSDAAITRIFTFRICALPAASLANMRIMRFNFRAKVSGQFSDDNAMTTAATTTTGNVVPACVPRN